MLIRHSRPPPYLAAVCASLRHERLVGQIEPQRRHRNAVVGERGEIGAVARPAAAPARIGDPVIRIAAAVMARIDVQELLVALALRR